MNNAHEIAKKYEEMMDDVAYPTHPRKPERIKFANNSSYGMAMDVWEEQMDEYRESLLKYKQEQARLIALFRNDVLKSLGLFAHPRADVLWKLAWDRGHASGLTEVATEMEELSELMM